MTDRQRIARLERDIERLEECVALLVESVCRDKYGKVWLPEYGPFRRMILRWRKKKRDSLFALVARSAAGDDSRAGGVS